VSPLPALIHIVDDDASFRTTTGRLLRVCGYDVVMYESAEQLLERLPDDAHPSCILLDVKIPGLSGPELQDRLAKLGSTLPIVFLTGHGDVSTTVRAIKAGAEDFLTKPVSKDKLIDAIERAVARSRAMREKSDQLTALRSLISALTPRERQVFEQVARGKMNKQIAVELGTTERTIKAHRQKVMEKLRAESLAELVLIAERFGFWRRHPKKQLQTIGEVVLARREGVRVPARLPWMRAGLRYGPAPSMSIHPVLRDNSNACGIPKYILLGPKRAFSGLA
jgi:FixJ family two-component response regulator